MKASKLTWNLEHGTWNRGQRAAIIAAVLMLCLNGVILAFAGEDYSWKVSDARYGAKTAKIYQGINEGLIWVKEIIVCPGGFNGSGDYQRFNNTGLQRYRVNKNGDLVFPDDTVWYKSEGYAKAHQGGRGAWEDAPDNSEIDDCADKDTQYEYAKNLPSALAIADAWDGVKNLMSGPPGTHKVENGYYADNSVSWYRDIGNGKGKSRLPTIEEYKKAGEELLLNETKNYSQYQWASQQGNDVAYRYGSRTYSAEGKVEGEELVSFPLAGCWILEK